MTTNYAALSIKAPQMLDLCGIIQLLCERMLKLAQPAVKRAVSLSKNEISMNMKKKLNKSYHDTRTIYESVGITDFETKKSN